MAEQNTRRLAGPVTVGNRTYQPGEELPDDVAERIRNPKAWVTAAEQETARQEAVKSSKPSGHPSGARLASRVTVAGVTYGPDDTIPDDVAKQIRNPKAWVDGKLPTLGGTTSEPTAPSAPISPPPAEPEPEPGPDGEPRGRRGGVGRRA